MPIFVEKKRKNRFFKIQIQFSNALFIPNKGQFLRPRRKVSKRGKLSADGVSRWCQSDIVRRQCHQFNQ